ncbi:hypothetical protein NQ318_005486 [Aromia moschata]|uniref:Cytochrome P450 n=1 Tax=Aromia moschata TaxID=1265417 RepID=A0AAV8XP62_9CUCU|nr:hypothetical protein NQ318_005486 [Aromia moschata]
MPYIEPPSIFGNLQNPLSGKSDLRGAVDAVYNKARAKGFRHVGIYSLSSPIYMPVDIELVKNVMAKDFNHFVDRGVYVNEKDDPMGAHLFALGGKRWRNLRVKLTPTFTSGKLKAMFQTLVDCGLVMETYIQANISNTDAVDIKDILSSFSTDIIGSCAFGIECNSFEQPDSPFRAHSKILLSRNKLGQVKDMFAQSFPALARALGVKLINPEVSQFYTKVVEDTVRYRLENNYKRMDLLQLLIDMKTEKKGQDDGYVGDGSSLTMNEIVAQCFLFFIAGFETSSSTMTFALFELASHQDLQDRVREELTTILTKHNNQMTYDSLNELKYMKQVIDETLRKYPPVSFVTRVCVKDYKVPDEDIVIEKGTRVFIPIRGIHYDARYFKDPEVFDPERFNEANKKNIQQYSHIPFGEGPRICIGERFGIMQTKVGLSCILRNFKVTLNKKTQLPLKMDPTKILPVAKGGVWLNLEKLQQGGGRIFIEIKKSFDDIIVNILKTYKYYNTLR